MEATGFGVMHVDEQDRITAFVEKPADPPGIPGQPDMALASMGIYVFRTKFLADLLRRDAETPGSSRDFGKDLIPYIVEHGKAVAHRFGASCVRSLAEVGRLLARRRHGRRLLGGEHRPDRHHPRARPLRHGLADLDLCRDQAAGEVRPRRRRPARQRGVEPRRRRLHHLGRLRSAGRCSSTGRARATPIASLDEAVILPDVDIGRRRQPAPGGGRPRRAHPRGAGRRRGPGARRQAVPAHRGRRLPDHPADDRQAGMRGSTDAGPLRHLRGLSAGQDRRPRRRRRRAARRRSAAAASRCARCCPAIPR